MWGKDRALHSLCTKKLDIRSPSRWLGCSNISIQRRLCTSRIHRKRGAETNQVGKNVRPSISLTRISCQKNIRFRRRRAAEPFFLLFCFGGETKKEMFWRPGLKKKKTRLPPKKKRIFLPLSTPSSEGIRQFRVFLKNCLPPLPHFLLLFLFFSRNTSDGFFSFFLSVCLFFSRIPARVWEKSCYIAIRNWRGIKVFLRSVKKKHRFFNFCLNIL